MSTDPGLEFHILPLRPVRAEQATAKCHKLDRRGHLMTAHNSRQHAELPWSGPG